MTDAQIQRLVSEIKERKAKADATTKSWWVLLRNEINQRGWQQKDFISHTLLSETVYKRLMGKTQKKLSLKSIVAICLGLRLPKNLSLRIIHNAGYSFDNSTIQYYYRTFIVEEWDIYDADAVLFAATEKSFSGFRDVGI